MGVKTLVRRAHLDGPFIAAHGRRQVVRDDSNADDVGIWNKEKDMYSLIKLQTTKLTDMNIVHRVESSNRTLRR